VDVADIGRADYLKVLGVELLLEVVGDQGFENALPDITGELLAYDRGRSLSGAEAGELGPFHDVGDGLVRLSFYRCGRDGNLESVLAAFY
jgi:hypothetical protein